MGSTIKIIPKSDAFYEQYDRIFNKSEEDIKKEKIIKSLDNYEKAWKEFKMLIEETTVPSAINSVDHGIEIFKLMFNTWTT